MKTKDGWVNLYVVEDVYSERQGWHRRKTPIDTVSVPNIQWNDEEGFILDERIFYETEKLKNIWSRDIDVDSMLIVVEENRN